jgi:hypothetical protein
MISLPSTPLPFIIRHSAIAYRPSTNSHRCASTHHLHPNHLVPHVLLGSRLALRHQVLQRRLLSATALGQWSPQHYPARRQSASPVQPIPTHQMTSPLHPLHPSHMHIPSWMNDSDELHCLPHHRKEEPLRQLATIPPTRLKERPRSVFPLYLCPILKQTVNMNKITSLSPLWLLLHHCGAALVAAERKIGNLSPGNFVNPDGRARMAE